MLFTGKHFHQELEDGFWQGFVEAEDEQFIEVTLFSWLDGEPEPGMKMIRKDTILPDNFYFYASAEEMRQNYALALKFKADRMLKERP